MDIKQAKLAWSLALPKGNNKHFDLSWFTPRNEPQDEAQFAKGAAAPAALPTAFPAPSWWQTSVEAAAAPPVHVLSAN
jgi:hypothetical protein